MSIAKEIFQKGCGTMKVTRTAQIINLNTGALVSMNVKVMFDGGGIHGDHK